MTFKKIIFLTWIFASLTSCATTGFNSEKDNGNNSNVIPAEQHKQPNSYGWDDSNCAHIMADRHCAHPTGANASDNPFPTPSEVNSSNCAHVMADGTCAHPL